MSGSICTICRGEPPPGSRFCPVCGTRLETQVPHTLASIAEMMRLDEGHDYRVSEWVAGELVAIYYLGLHGEQLDAMRTALPGYEFTVLCRRTSIDGTWARVNVRKRA
jgi:hypothetical protein